MVAPALCGAHCRCLTGGSTPASSLSAEAQAAMSVLGSDTTPDKDQVDPFRVGYNMGMQNVQLETLRIKMDDNRELLKSHLRSLQDTSKVNYESMQRLQEVHGKKTVAEIHEYHQMVLTRFEHLNERLLSNEESMREMHRQQFSSLQKHFDDRLENIKDTVKISGLILVALNILTLFFLQGGSKTIGDGSAGRVAAAQRRGNESGSPHTGATGSDATAQQQPATKRGLFS